MQTERAKARMTFSDQLAAARRPDGGVDIRKLAELVVAAYEKAERKRRRSGHMLLRMNRALKHINARLVDAFEAIPEGLALFDSDDRYVVWNRRYADLYRDSRIEAGMRFEDVLRDGLARGQYPDAVGREEEWLAERMRLHREHRASHEQRLSDGRWLRVEERQTADGGSIGIRIDITELKHREEGIRLLFETNPVPMWVYDRKTLRFLAVNDAACQHYGYPRERFLNMTLLDIRPAEDHEKLKKFVVAIAGVDRKGTPWRHLKADGTAIEAMTFARALHYEGHDASLVAAIDMTERKRAEDDLKRTRTFLDTIVENVPTAILMKSARDLSYAFINRAGEQLYGISRENIIGRTAADVFPRETAEGIAALDGALLQLRGQQVVEDHPVVTPGGDKRVVSSKRIPIFDADGEPEYLLAVIEDVTERARAQERIAFMAHHDPLTGLPNRAAFNEHFVKRIERATTAKAPFAVLCIDLDRFKEVNDLFGHGIGDKLLCEVARRMQTVAEGLFLARLGGDEFTLIVEGPQPETAEAIGHRLQTAVSEEFDIVGQKLRIGLSVGIAIHPTDSTEAATLLANADAALYSAKADGRGAVRFYEAEMNQRLRERRALQRDLASALDNGELFLHYQPLARIDGEISGFETLVRWRHPTRGDVSPSVFIPIAEESGLIVTIGEWILREACREAASWSRPLPIAVNLSPVQFRHGDLPGFIHGVLLETGLNAKRLELEITEGVLINDFSRTIAILGRLKALGLRIAMDDFGTGYSSLSYLQSFPFDKIKIDRSFISNLDQNMQSAAIVRAVLALGRGLSLPVVAEGVETKSQLDFLAGENCGEVQGYLIGKPAPIAAYGDLVGRTRNEAPAEKRARAG
jgi:diguanylate cyclase (GGDEF)-like protein/PAS domain S-box-containing protein